MQENQALDQIINKYKGRVIKEFEKICPTQISFHRVKKDMHDIFEDLLREIEEQTQINN